MRYYVLVGLLFCSSALYSQDPITELDLSGKVPAAVHAAHAKLFDKDQPINSLQLVIAKDSPSNKEINVVVGSGEMFFSPKDPPTPEKRLKRMVCSADSIAVVLIGESESSFSSQRDWVYTDYLAKVTRVIKQQKPIDTGHMIVIGLAGGELELSPGKRLKVDDGPRPAKGKQYLMFLRYVPESGQYINSGALFSVNGEQLKPMAQDESLFLNEISTRYDLARLSAFAKEQSCSER
jgi:hypothetical protein